MGTTTLTIATSSNIYQFVRIIS